MRKMSNQDIYENQKNINRYTSGGKSCFLGVEMNSDELRRHNYSANDDLNTKSDSEEKKKKTLLINLMHKQYRHQKSSASSLEKIDYQQRVDPVLKNKIIKEKYQGLMKTDFSMNKDLESLNNDLEKV